MVPGRFAEIDELTGIGAGLGAAGAGTFGMNSDFEDERAEFTWITRLSKETGRPVWFLLTDRPTDPERWRRIMAGVHAARAAGASVTAQVRAPSRGHSRCGDLAQPVRDPRALQPSGKPAARRAPLAPARPGGAPRHPRRPAVANAAGPVRTARPARRRTVEPDVRDGRPARLRTARRDQRRRDRSPRRSLAGRGRL